VRNVGGNEKMSASYHVILGAIGFAFLSGVLWHWVTTHPGASSLWMVPIMLFVFLPAMALGMRIVNAWMK